jgi:tRNA A-37 threonylcarbamoyl transferase component Bud32
MAEITEDNKTYVLNFTYNYEDSCALTVLINDVRLQIIVDPKDLQKSREKSFYYEYLDKVCGLRDAERLEQEDVEKSRVVGKKHSSPGQDSAVEVSSDAGPESDLDQDSPSAARELQNWILSAFTDIISESAPPNREPIDSTLHEWYHGPTYFYCIHIKAGKLEPELLETNDELNEGIGKLVPRLKMPKYIQEIDLPWLNANDLTVQNEVSFPEPAHPGKVTHNETGKVYFFKPVAADDPGPVKREISILQELGKLELDAIKVPKLLGFVAFENSNTEITGMLLQHIEEPTPLTKLLKKSVSRFKRAEWSRKCEKYVHILHDNDIIWGDAKADNFVVDKDGELWIIDFGGSFTEGWVDPELSETLEGDQMGLDKIQRALEEPDKNTYEPHGEGEVLETASSLFVTEKPQDGGGKRKRDYEEEKHEDQGAERKKMKDSEEESDEEYVDEE